MSAYGYYWKKRRYGGIFESELLKVKERESFSQDQWNDYQTIEFKKLVLHAFDTVPFYKNKYSNHGLTRDDLKKIDLDSLHRIPALEKDELRQFGKTSLISSRREKGGVYFSSSGSTGTPTHILYSKKMHQRYTAASESRSRNWARITRHDSRGMIGGRRVVPEGTSKGPYFRYNWSERQVYFSAYHISADTASDYAEAIRKYKLDYMTGYAMSNYFLAQFFDDNNIKVPQLKAVITSSEKLTPAMRKLFKKVYGCKTYDGYSGVEACGMISENEYGQLLISPDVGIMEIIKEDGSFCTPGETGEIVSTGLLNYDQPLIRYRIGDYVKLAKNQHTLCGRNMPVIEEISGRVEDTVIGPDGRKMVRFHGIFIDIPNLINSQVIQKDYDKYVINLVISEDYEKSKFEKVINGRMTSQLGEVSVKFRYLKNLVHGKNGKYKAVISEVSK